MDALGAASFLQQLTISLLFCWPFFFNKSISSENENKCQK